MQYKNYFIKKHKRDSKINWKILNSNLKTKEGILNFISKNAFKNNIITGEKTALKEFLEREKQFSTGFEQGIAIPHIRSKTVSKPSIFIVRNKIESNWKGLDEDVKKAKYVLLAIDKPIDSIERFDNKKILKTNTSSVIKDMKKVFEDLKQAKLSRTNTTGKNDSRRYSGNSSNIIGRPKIMAAIMNGLSYMIPVVIVGGILLAFLLRIGRLFIGGDVTKAKDSGWHTTFQIGVAGIQLAIVLLAGFIAQALGGHMAMAPTMILAYVAQGIGMGDANFTFLITDNTAHTGPIVYFLGAVGKNGIIDYLYGLLYILALFIGVFVTSTMFIILETIYSKRKNKKETIKDKTDKETNVAK